MVARSQAPTCINAPIRERPNLKPARYQRTCRPVAGAGSWRRPADPATRLSCCRCLQLAAGACTFPQVPVAGQKGACTRPGVPVRGQRCLYPTRGACSRPVAYLAFGDHGCFAAGANGDASSEEVAPAADAGAAGAGAAPGSDADPVPAPAAGADAPLGSAAGSAADPAAAPTCTWTSIGTVAAAVGAATVSPAAGLRLRQCPARLVRRSGRLVCLPRGLCWLLLYCGQVVLGFLQFLVGYLHLLLGRRRLLLNSLQLLLCFLQLLLSHLQLLLGHLRLLLDSLSGLTARYTRGGCAALAAVAIASFVSLVHTPPAPAPDAPPEVSDAAERSDSSRSSCLEDEPAASDDGRREKVLRRVERRMDACGVVVPRPRCGV
eukprot:353262-Chlamydomonas_euryale.AAC.6